MRRIPALERALVARQRALDIRRERFVPSWGRGLARCVGGGRGCGEEDRLDGCREGRHSRQDGLERGFGRKHGGDAGWVGGVGHCCCCGGSWGWDWVCEGEGEGCEAEEEDGLGEHVCGFRKY